MPFIPKKDRPSLLKGYRMAETPGEECFLVYVELMRRWKANRRWREVNAITQELFNLNPASAAKLLAFLVFMVDEVMPYEREQKKKNGAV